MLATTRMLPDIWALAFDQVTDELLDSAGISRPPIKIFDLAERLGICVAMDALQTGRGRFKRIDGLPAIFLRPDDRQERLQWAAAHEVGESVAFRVSQAAGWCDDSISPRLREDIANRMASLLLLPARWFMDDAHQLNGDILALKQVYRTASHELIAYRLLALSAPSIISVFDQGRLTRRKTNRENACPRLQPIERACWQEAHRLNRSVEMSAHGLCVQAWPVHEGTWKREIVWTTVTDVDDF